MDIPVQRTAPARETMPRLSPSAWGVFPVGSAPRRATKAQTGQQQKRAERRGVRPAWQRIYFGSEKHRFRGAWGRSCACAAIPPALPLVKFRNIQTVPGLLERSALQRPQWGWRVGIPLWAGRRSAQGIGRRHRLTKGEGCLTDGTSLFPAGQRKLERLWLARTCAQGRGRLGQFLRGILRSGHQHQKVPGRRIRTPRRGAAAAGPAPGRSPRWGGGHCHPQGVAGLHLPARCGQLFPEAPPGGLQFPPGAGDTPSARYRLHKSKDASVK